MGFLRYFGGGFRGVKKLRGAPAKSVFGFNAVVRAVRTGPAADTILNPVKPGC
ncbi:MAG: hypothetical protein NZ739_07590 [Verrucomicrobiae bacterium]|nr:hypothetical protein [Verrucomicrobiae bacterium]